MKEENGRVRLAEELATDETDQLSALRSSLLDIVLRPANCPPKKKGHEGDSDSRARDFVTAACWCLLQDPYAFQSNYEAYVHRIQDDQGFKAVQNDVRWNGFVRWSVFLGLAVHVKGGILLNPAVAVRRAARDILPVGERQDLGAFLQKLAVRVPVLPGGASSAQVLRENQDTVANLRVVRSGAHDRPCALATSRERGLPVDRALGRKCPEVSRPRRPDDRGLHACREGVMRSLERYWPTDASVRDCLKVDAEAADPAVLLAVHQPMRLRRRQFGVSADPRACGEEDLLRALLATTGDGRVIVPIVGNSGVGKSHVIRWLDARLHHEARGREPGGS